MILQAAPQLPHRLKPWEIQKEAFQRHPLTFRLQRYFETLGLSPQARSGAILTYQAGGGGQVGGWGRVEGGRERGWMGREADSMVGRSEERRVGKECVSTC